MQDDLDDMLAAARHRGTDPSAAFLARVLADAEAVQDGWKATPRVFTPSPRPGWRRLMTFVLGGAGATAGMATAALAGVWIGYAQPETLTTVTSAIWVDQRVDLIPSFDFVTE